MFILVISIDIGRLIYSALAITLVAIIFGWLLPAAYLLLEALVFRVMLGRSIIATRLRRIAREDFALLAEEYEHDRGLTKQVAKTVAVVARLFHLIRLLRELRNLRREKAVELYEGLIRKIRYAWRDGLQTSIILDYMNILKRLSAPSDDLYLEGSAVIANLTYLLGELEKGRRLGEKNMKEAKVRDGNGIPKNQWRASYAYSNSQLFLGRFDDAAWISDGGGSTTMRLSTATFAGNFTMNSSFSFSIRSLPCHGTSSWPARSRDRRSSPTPPGSRSTTFLGICRRRSDG